MHLDELTDLVAAVDRSRGGCSVTITTINTPPASRGTLYGYVMVGPAESQFVFHGEKELRDVLEKAAKR